MKLTPKLAFVFISFAVTILIGVGTLVYFSGRTALEAATFAELQSTSVEKSSTVDAWFAERASDISALSHSPGILEDVEKILGNAPERSSAETRLTHELSIRTGQGQPYLAIFILSPDTGEALLATDPAGEGEFSEDRDYFVQGKIAPFVSKVYYSSEIQGPAIMATAPIQGEDGRLLGILAGQLNLEELNAIIQRRSGLRQTDDAFLVNTSNLFVTQPFLLLDPAVLQRGVHTMAVRRCLEDRSTGTLFALDYINVPSLITYRWLPEHEMCLIVKMSQAEALAPIQAFGRTTVWIALLTLAVASVVAFALSRTITRPVLAMQKAVQRYGRGDSDVRLLETRGDELGVLAHEFNQMAASLAEKDLELRTYAQTLEQKVQERTKDLQEAHFRLSRAEQIGQIGSWDWNILKNRVTWSDGLFRIFGLTPQEFAATYEGFLARLHTDEVERMQQAVQTTLQENGSFEIETRILRTDGQLRTLYVRGESLLDEHGTSARLIGVAIDVTERKRAEEELRESEQRLKRAQEIAHLGSWELDLVSNQLTWSDEVYRIFGLHPQEFGATYEAFLEAVHPEDRAAVNAAYSESIQAGRDIYEIEHRVVRQSTGEIRIVYEKCEHFRNADGQIIRSVGMVHDLTERKRAEEQLERTSQKLNEILTSIQDDFYVLDWDWNFVYASRLFTSKIGKEPEDFVGNNIWEIFPQHVGTVLEENFRAAMEKRDVRRFEIGGQCTSAWYRMTAFPSAEGITVLGTDITERKRAEVEIASLAKFPTENPNPILRVQIDGRLTYANPASQELLEIWHSKVDDYLPEELKDLVSEAMKQGLNKTIDVHCNDKVYSILLVPIKEAAYVNIYGRDITERKLAEEELRRTLEELKYSNAELEQFAYVASHDLQEPLRMVSSYMQLLARRYQGKLDSDADEFINFAVDGAKRMQTLINDLLTFSRVGTRGRPLALTSCDEVIGEALSNLQLAIEESATAITYEPLPQVKGDPTQLVQLFQNLLSNAIKFRRRDLPCIHVSVRRENSEWIFSVRDNGIGIDPKFADRIFIIFQRLHDRGSYPGTGIGLAICKRIVQRHGGRIWVESEPGEGATFYFTLPSKETI